MSEFNSSATNQHVKKTLSSKTIATIIPVTVVAMVVFTGILNAYMNPMVYRSAYMNWIGEQMEQGQNIAIFDPNINWRALRREQIIGLNTTPEVVVSGGSRWQEAATSHVPDKIFFNAHGHSDYNEDFFAIVYLLEKNNRMPETLILSLRYRIFEPVALRKHTGWREWAPEYRAMAKKIGIEPHPSIETHRMNHWAALFSVEDLWQQIQYRMNTQELAGPTDAYTLKTLDVIGSDGSLRWSQENAARFTPDFAEKDARNRLARFIDFDLQIDMKMVDSVKRLLAYLKKKNVNVVLAQTPFHPVFYDGIQGTKFGKTLAKIDQIGEQYAQTYGLQKVGSFNPHELGCSREEFIDWHHGTPKCLSKVFAQIDFSSQML
jgi:hypothetical protein